MSGIYSGAGNTFVLTDNRNAHFDIQQVPTLCRKKEVDGVLLIEQSSNADAFLRIFNRNGSEAEMCGNGLRCCIHFLKELGILKDIYHIETLAGVQKGWFVEDEVCVQLTSPTCLKLYLNGITPQLHFVNTGVPHAVLFVDSLDESNVEAEGKRLRHSPLFAPAGSNINFVQLRKDNSLDLRTYERGVEAETQACGTGATAAALIAHHIYYLASPIDVWVRSKERLRVAFNRDWSEVTLLGPARRREELVLNRWGIGCVGNRAGDLIG